MQENRAEAEIQRLNLELETANQNLEAFNYSVSHDLRAPLRHILGYVDILQTVAGRTLDETSRKHLLTIAQSATQMEQMFDTLLDFYRSGSAEMHIQRVSLAALVKDAQRELHSEINGRAIDWQIGDLPEVQGDSTMLREAIGNLLSNAVKFTRPRRAPRIEIGTKNGGREMIFSVRDNGVGFDMNCASRLFGVFQRLHPVGEFEGAGVGLAKVRRIIQRHSGRTWTEAKPKEGATFYFSIPKPSEAAA